MFLVLIIGLLMLSPRGPYPRRLEGSRSITVIMGSRAPLPPLTFLSSAGNLRNYPKNGSYMDLIKFGGRSVMVIIDDSDTDYSYKMLVCSDMARDCSLSVYSLPM